jgi:hypothetical protein
MSAAGSSSPAKQGLSAAAAADGLPAKPGSTLLSPNEIIAACRQAKAAAQANARIRPATFVLPAGGPDEEAAPEQRMPQGKGRPQGGDGSNGVARKQVRERVLALVSVGCSSSRAVKHSAAVTAALLLLLAKLDCGSGATEIPWSTWKVHKNSE